MIVGLTGGIGSGKSAAGAWFASQDIDVIDADIVAKEVLTKDSSLLTTLVKTFGAWVLQADGTYNRPAMRQYVFTYPKKLAQLNAITHPAIYQKIIHDLQCSTSIYTILVAPLLFDNYATSPLPALCQRFLLIDVPRSVQIQRASYRDKTTDIAAIIAKQLDRQNRLAIAKQLPADIADNSQDLSYLYAQLASLHQRYLALANAHF